LGRFGARKRDRKSGMTGKITATTRNRAIGPNVPSTCAQYTQGGREVVWAVTRTESGRGVMVRAVTSVLPPASEKPRFVAEMFSRIAPRYDLMNTLMTFGQDAAWRRMVADAVLAAGAQRGTLKEVLDVGTGTGRLAQAVLERVPSAHVVAVDFTYAMLHLAPGKLQTAAADALRLPFGDERFDAVVSGFVVRNLADVRSGLAEQVRVLKPGGLLVILETTPGPGGVLRPLYRLYFRNVVPLLGALIAGDPSAYTYLPESTLAFLEPKHLAELMRECGLRTVETRQLMFGSVGLTVARKPLRPE
jgi:demethylmenaquinone methyltransferase / 2-methoxy-6-polyprenyl-1,4-benzoquinol methylase